MLFAYFVCSGAYNLTTNLDGDFCEYFIYMYIVSGVQLNRMSYSCIPTFIFRSSLANNLKY